MGMDDYIDIKTSLTIGEVISTIMSRFEKNFEIHESISASGIKSIYSYCKYFYLGLYDKVKYLQLDLISQLGFESNVRGLLRYYRSPYSTGLNDRDYFNLEELKLHQIWVYEELIKLTEEYDWQIGVSHLHLEDCIFTHLKTPMKLVSSPHLRTEIHATMGCLKDGEGY
ncbi:MAG: hypothetical protein MUF87_20700 [Anaerolineae bacterium]|nr:hypothetical protein [Anaerolineae bacterium]